MKLNVAEWSEEQSEAEKYKSERGKKRSKYSKILNSIKCIKLEMENLLKIGQDYPIVKQHSCE